MFLFEGFLADCCGTFGKTLTAMASSALARYLTPRKRIKMPFAYRLYTVWQKMIAVGYFECLVHK